MTGNMFQCLIHAGLMKDLWGFYSPLGKEENPYNRSQRVIQNISPSSSFRTHMILRISSERESIYRNVKGLKRKANFKIITVLLPV